MLTALGKIVVAGIVIFAFCLILCLASGCTFLPAIDAALGTIVPNAPPLTPGEAPQDMRAYIVSGLTTLALGALALYIRSVKKNGATKKDLEDLKADPASNI